jgi:Domain of unknown function (DUF2828)
MAFVQAMSNPHTKTGVNGESVLTETGVGDRRLTLYTMLTRGLEASYIEREVDAMFGIADVSQEVVADLFVLAFQTRDVRGGKGERDLFHQLLKALYKHRPALVRDLLHLVPEYGCWRDLWELHTIINDPAFRAEIYRLVRSTLEADSQQTDDRKLSLLAKWMPREGSKTYPGLSHTLAAAMYPDIPAGRRRLASYRRMITGINRRLDTVEIHMCGGTWSDIVPKHVPGRNLKIHRQAFLNVPCTKAAVVGCGNKNTSSDTLRYPDSEDRMHCRQNFLDFLGAVKAGKATAKGADVVQPHEIVTEIENVLHRQNIVLSERTGNEDEIAILEAQWSSIRDAVLAAGGFGRAVAMCDFSGSMAGIPMQVSKAIGLLISETTAPAFRDHILTFDSTPAWYAFPAGSNITQKLNSLYGVGQGLSTNFYAACMMILDRMVAAKVPVGEEPEDLIVLTDMGWDQASGSGSACMTNAKAAVQATGTWKSQIQRIQEAFKAAGGWRVPRIIVWNLRAAFKDFQATAADEGVVVVSGWSPSVLKALMKDGGRTMTPMAGLRAVLDDPRYDAVRRIVGAL